MTMGPPDPSPRGRRRGRYVVLGALLALLVLSVPWWGRRLDFFRLRHVEVRGTRFTQPSDIVRRLGIDTMTSIWISVDSLRERIERHPQVARATVRRWLPSTIIVEISENEPIAFVPGEKGMRVFEEGGQALPLDPARVPTDLPVVERRDTAAFRLLAELKAEAPTLYARVSEVRFPVPGQLRIEFSDVPVLAMRGVSAARFVELSSVERDLAARGVVPAEFDLRFRDQVIVRLP